MTGFLINPYVLKEELEDGWDLTAASYANKSFSVADQDTAPAGLFLSPDGTKMYMAGGNDSIFQYSLSTPWDVSTASYANKSFYAGNQDSGVTGVTFSPDGTKMYIPGNITDYVYQYSLSTPWDVSTASYANKSFYAGNQDPAPFEVIFNNDGTKMYVAGATSGDIHQYSLSTAWDISTASYDNKSFDGSNEESSPRALFFKPDGTRLFVAGLNADAVFQYDLSTPWDILTASYNSISLDVAAEEGTINGLFIKPDGSTLYLIGQSAGTAYQYSL